MSYQNEIESALPVIEDILRFLRGKNRLKAEEWEDFHAWVWVKLVASDYAAVRKFDGRGTLRAYLAVVLSRLLLDYRVQKWGKWRPSAKATSLGPHAVDLERLIQRESFSVSDAVQTLVVGCDCRLREEELFELAAQLPPRRKDWTTSEDWIEEVPSTRPTPEGELRSREVEEAQSRLEAALARALARLGPQERLAIRMRYEQGLKLNEVARALGRDPKLFYRQFERILGRLRRFMNRDGVAKEQLELAFPQTDWGEFADSSRL